MSQSAIFWSAASAIPARERLHPEVACPDEDGWEPAIDILETETGLLIVVALAGVRREDIETIIALGQLLVRGIRRWPLSQLPARVHRVELPHGCFERRLPLPPGTYRLRGQEHVDGCLLLTLPRVD